MRLSVVALIAVAAFSAVGCDETQSTSATSGTTLASAPRTGPPSDCTPIEPNNDRYLLCGRPNQRGYFLFRGRGRIPIAYPTTGPAGHWSAGFRSPDGDTLLAQWRAECEVPYAFFVPMRGGTPRLVTGDSNMRHAPPSIAHGWTDSGEAIVEVIPGCNEASPHAPKTELWLISPNGKQRRLRALP